jgi:lipid-A-disaccharide synthase
MSIGAGPLVFMIAGEPSGDALGGRLMAALRRQTGDSVRFEGIGGPAMAEEGLRSLFPMAELSIMGLAEIVPKIPHLLRRIRETAASVERLRPAALVTIDAPDFSFRVARRVGRSGVPRIHYVAPSVWAWRPRRAATIARFLDHLLALLPFEPPYFERVGLPCSFVGHPAIETQMGAGDGHAFRERHVIAHGRRIVLMLPGSRHGEVRRLLPVFIATLCQMRAAGHDFKVVIPVGAHIAETVRTGLMGSALDALVVEGDSEKADAFAAADAALAKSGTVTLELALAGVPAVIGYRMNPLTYAVVSRVAVGRFAGLPNVILDRLLVPELLQYECRPDRLAAALTPLIDDGEARRTQLIGLADIRRRLSLPGIRPSDAAAEIVLRVAREKMQAGLAQRAPIGT